MQNPVIRFKSVSKSFNKKFVLQNCTLDIMPNEFFALVGVNGAGKTTLIKCLLDFCDADTGSIEIFGESHRNSSSRRHLSFLPERFVPPYYLRGKDFLQYMLELQSMDYDEAAVRQVLQRLELDFAVLSSPIRAYSKGMIQKLGLAACVLSNKPLYILDEPSSGLDPKARARLKSELELLKNKAYTVFFTSHSLVDVQEICDRMAILHDGRLIFVGTPGALCEKFEEGNLEQAFLRCIATPSDEIYA